MPFLSQTFALKPLTIAMSAMIFLATPTDAAPSIGANSILGEYRNPDGSRSVRVYKKNGRFFGVIASAPAQPDGNEGVGFVVFKNFEYDPKTKSWRNGKLHSPMYLRGVYSGRLSLRANGDLRVRGFIGVPLLGGSSTFPRIR